MNKNPFFLSNYPFSLILMLLFFTCSPKKVNDEKAFYADLELAMQEKKMLETGVQQLSDWILFWQSVDPTFNPSVFEIERKDQFEELEWPEENYIVSDSPFYPFLLPNPNGGGFVDIYSYKVFVPTEGKPGFQPDSEVIYFKSNGMRERLLFIGPSGGFEEALWVSAEHLLVAGFFEEEEGVTPKIWIIDTVNKGYSIYKYPLHTTNYAKDGYLRKKLSNLEF
jgi:hypothetical protein